MEKLEVFQRQATKRMKSLEGKSYEESLRERGIFSLQKKRLKGERVAVFRYRKSWHQVQGECLFPLSEESRTDTNGLRLQQRRFRLDTRKDFFTGKAVTAGWAAPASSSLQIFNQRLDKHWSRIIWKYSNVCYVL